MPSEPRSNREHFAALGDVIDAIYDDTPAALPSPDAGGTTPTTEHPFDYPAAARSLYLWLQEFCDTSLPFPQMIAEAGRRAAREIERLRSPAASPPADSAALVEKLLFTAERVVEARGGDAFKTALAEHDDARAKLDAFVAALHARVERGAKIEAAATAALDFMRGVALSPKGVDAYFALRAALSAPPSPHP